MPKQLCFIWGIVALIILGGCAGKMNSNSEPPIVSLHTFNVLPHGGITPRFEIGLNIINPNRKPLYLEGIYYSIAIEGYKVLAGVSNKLPIVEPYGEADITLLANIDLISGINFFSSLLNDPRDSFEYSFNAKLDPGGFTPEILIQEQGRFSLQNQM